MSLSTLKRSAARPQAVHLPDHAKYASTIKRAGGFTAVLAFMAQWTSSRFDRGAGGALVMRRRAPCRLERRQTSASDGARRAEPPPGCGLLLYDEVAAEPENFRIGHFGAQPGAAPAAEDATTKG